MAFPCINSAFQQLLAGKFPDDETPMQTVQRFVVLLYDVTSHSNSVNDCRRVLFIHKNRAIENIPPTESALCQHVKRATLQAIMWKRCLERLRASTTRHLGMGEIGRRLSASVVDHPRCCKKLSRTDRMLLQKTMLFM